VKPGDGAKVRAGAKILNYWKLYSTGGTQYFIDEEQVRPKYFLVGTQYSPWGRLFDSDEVLKPVDASRARAINYGLIPQSEYTQTFNFVRHLWATWRDEYERTPGYAVGVLLSDLLDDDGAGYPAFMCQEHQGRWKQKWRRFG
jgi:hypothetical protein